MTVRDLAMLAAGWDAAVAAMRYEDGTPVEIVSMVNPYRGRVSPDPICVSPDCPRHFHEGLCCLDA